MQFVMPIKHTKTESEIIKDIIQWFFPAIYKVRQQGLLSLTETIKNIFVNQNKAEKNKI